MTDFTLTTMSAADIALVEGAAHLLMAAFSHQPDTWDTLDAARQEVSDALQDEHINIVAVDAAGGVIGWVGGFHAYAQVWEMHPLAVLPPWQRRGVGTTLVRAFETAVRTRGGLVIMLGTDDVLGQTSLAGKDLYPDLWTELANLRNLNGHPVGFYQRLGYRVTGVIPDANGFGRPDILMCRRLA